MDLEVLFNQYKIEALYGRYITLTEIEPILKKLNKNYQLNIVGYSVLEKPIYSYQIGVGKTKIFLWSQMHGNESTTTKALFDFLNLLNDDSEFAKQLLDRFSFYCLPMVNPDGAQLYIRENANLVDLNRDAQNLTQPESQVLRECFDKFKPHYCYNLHDQRTIFGVGSTGKPATVSFLAPSYNEARDVNEVRLKAIDVIMAMNEALQEFISGQVGRFDDSFNINCIGDTFQSMNVPTILIEAGHYQNDYFREKTRKFIFFALLSGFKYLFDNVVVGGGIQKYLSICQNKVVFYDIVYKNVKINYDCNEKMSNIAIQFKEELLNNTIIFNAFIVKIGDLNDYFGHFEYDCAGAVYSDEDENIPKLNQKANFFLDKKMKIVNGMIK